MRRCGINILLITSFSVACESPAARSLQPQAARPTPAPTLPASYRITFAKPYKNGVILLPTSSIKAPVVAVSEGGVEQPLEVPATFESRRPEVATVDSDGTIVGVSMGNTWIVASANALGSDSLEIRVRCTLELGMDLSPSETTIRVGESFVPTIQLWTCGRHVLIDETFTWSTPHSDVVSVDSLTGRTTGRAPGLAAVYPVGRTYRSLSPILVTVSDR
jgi:hypothetical protein